MKDRKFWNWVNQEQKADQETVPEGRVLTINGTIAEESWFDDDVTPKLFKDELMGGEGDVTLWINSPGGDCIAAAQIYNMLSEYPGRITVKIDGLAASAASVIAMAGDEVLMSPVSMMMIHNPATIAFGDHAEMQKAIDMLSEVKESIINAYVIKTGQSRAKLSHLMDAETWMDATKAVELGFADGVIEKNSDNADESAGSRNSVLFSRSAVNNALVNKLTKKFGEQKKELADAARIPEPTGVSAKDMRNRLETIEKLI
ncbi:MAG: Clp protease ClpP [Butyrivibrio sp.]|nr:Clp protease ClpP [Butyrivibrio sp.]